MIDPLVNHSRYRSHSVLGTLRSSEQILSRQARSTHSLTIAAFGAGTRDSAGAVPRGPFYARPCRGQRDEISVACLPSTTRTPPPRHFQYISSQNGPVER